MDIYLAGTDVSIVIPLVDRQGNSIAATAVDYRVTDELENELVVRTPVPGFAPGSSSVSLTVPASVNQLNAATDIRKARTVQLFVRVGGNTVTIESAYGIELEGPLVFGVNSFQSYAQAQMTSLEVPNTAGWDAASGDDRVAALIEARNRLCKLSYSLLNSNVNYSQDQLAYVPEGQYATPYIARNSLFLFTGNLELLNQQQIQAMPPRFIKALQLAQLAEADYILSGDSINSRRADGLILDSVGESKQMYRASKPVEMPVSKRALLYVSYYITFAKKIGRAG